MHPRSLKRPAHRGTITAAVARDLMRASLPGLRLVQPPTAFGVVNGTLAVIRAFEINWPFTGATLAFAVGDEVDLAFPENWIGGESIVIIVTEASKGHRLLAVPQRQVSAQTVLGGFDLAEDCAVLANSMWDANLESVAPAPQPEAVSRIAEIFVARQRDGFDDTTLPDLVREGIPEADALAYQEAAIAQAARTPRDRDIVDTTSTYDRAARVRMGAAAIAGLLDPGTVNTTLHQAGLTTSEIGHLFDDIVTASAALVRQARTSLAEVA